MKEATSLEIEATTMSSDLDKAVGWDLPRLELKAMVLRWDNKGATCLVPKEAATIQDLGEATCRALKTSRMSWDLDKDDKGNLNEVSGLESILGLEEDVEWNLDEVPGLEHCSDLDEDVEWDLDEVPGLETSSDLDDDAEWNLDEVLGVESSSDLEGDEWNLNEVRGLESSSSLDEDVELNLTEVPGLEPSSDLDEDVESNLDKVPGLESKEIEDHYEPTRHVFVSFLSLFYFFPLKYFIGTLLVGNSGNV